MLCEAVHVYHSVQPSSLPAAVEPPTADFIKAQWTICDKEYHEPAMQICRDIKCNHALTKAQLHDALVNVSIISCPCMPRAL